MTINQEEKSYRKPFKPPMDKRWWLKLRYYLFYIARESTAFFMLWLSIVLMFGVVSSYTNEYGQDEFYRFVFFLQHPVVLVLNVLALLAALFHSITWFNLAPKAINLVIAGKKPAAGLFVAIFWLITIVVSMTLLLIVLGYCK